MKIITHNGLFHADEVFAVALLKTLKPEATIERTREIGETDYLNPDVFLVDVGLKYNYSLNNYDHHQDSKLPASNLLVLGAVLSNGWITLEECTELKSMFEVISNIDTGLEEYAGFQVSGLIRSLNFVDNGFELALTVATAWIKSKIASANKAAESEQLLKEGTHVNWGIITTAYPVHWKRKEEYKYLICPQGTDWQLHSLNSSLYPIIATGSELFIHNKLFLAVYRTKDEAITAMLNSMNHLK